MRKVLLLLMLSIFVSATSFAQIEKSEAPKSKNKAVELLEAKGSCLVKEFYDLRKIKGLECQVLIVNDIVSGEKMGCLKLYTQYKAKRYDDYKSDRGILESDELDACIQSLEYMKNTLFPSAPTVYTEAGHRTNDNVIFGAYYKTGKWTAYVLTRYYSDSYEPIVLNVEDINSLIAVMHKAKSIIAEKTK